MENVMIYIVSILGVTVLGVLIYEFFQLSKERQIEIVKEWLLLAVIKAEKELGAKTGQIKLRFVYDMFLAKFKWLSYVISFESFSDLVDEALDKMRFMLTNNEAVDNYINSEEK